MAAAAAPPGGGLVLPPLATAADLQAVIAPLQAVIAPLQAVIAPLQAAIAPLPAAIAQLQAAIAQLQAQIASIIPADVASTAVRILEAREFNCGRRLRLRVVPRGDGAAPAHWPAGLTYSRVQLMTIPTLNNLLQEYGLPLGGGIAAKRERLLVHIGYYASDA